MSNLASADGNYEIVIMTKAKIVSIIEYCKQGD